MQVINGKDLLDAIRDVVDEKVRDMETFTAWDVSIIVWDQGYLGSHDVIKEVLHDGYRYQNWASCYMKRYFDLGKGHAAVYYHKDVNPQTYIDAVKQKIADELVAQSQPDEPDNEADDVLTTFDLPQSQPDQDDEDDTPLVAFDTPRVQPSQDDEDDIDILTGITIVKNVDDKNRLRFSKEVMECAGYGPGDKVAVEFKHGEVIIRPPDNSGNLYIIDEHSNIRVSLNVAAYTASAYKIDVTGNKIVASPID